jgi:hypothetical protein
LNDDRKVQSEARGQDGRAPARSRWFDDETIEIGGSAPRPKKNRVRAAPKTLGACVPEMLPLLREVYLDDGAEGDPKIEGSSEVFWCCDEHGWRQKAFLKG